MFYVRRIKWRPAKVTIVDFGPFETRQDAENNKRQWNRNKNTDVSIIQKGN